MQRIFKNDIKLTPDTIVAAWNPHNNYGDVDRNDVFLSRLKDLEFKQSTRNVVTLDYGRVVAYKDGNNYYAIDTKAEAEAREDATAARRARRAELEARDWDTFLEGELDKWDDFLTGLGYSYAGEDVEKGFRGKEEYKVVYYEATKDSLPFPYLSIHTRHMQDLLSGSPTSFVLQGVRKVPKESFNPRMKAPKDNATETSLYNKFIDDTHDLEIVLDGDTRAKNPITFYKGLLKRTEN